MPDFSAPVPVIENVPPPRPPEPVVLTAFAPLALILGVLIFSTARDIVNLHHHLQQSRMQNAQSAERLKKAGQESELVAKLRDEVAKLAQTDPVAARIKADFFPQATAPQTAPSDDTSTEKNPPPATN